MPARGTARLKPYGHRCSNASQRRLGRQSYILPGYPTVPQEDVGFQVSEKNSCVSRHPKPDTRNPKPYSLPPASDRLAALSSMNEILRKHHAQLFCRAGIIRSFAVMAAGCVVFFCTLPPASAQPPALPRATAAEAGRDIPRQYQFAKGLWDRELYKMAAKEFARFAAENPGHELADRARYYHVQSLVRHGEPEAALNIIRQIRKTDADYEYADRLTLLAGELHLKRQNATGAVQEFQRLIRHQDPGIRETAIYYLGEAYALADKRGNAAAMYTRLAAKPIDENHPFRAYGAFALAGIYREVEQFDKAAAQYERLAGNASVPARLREEALFQAGVLAESQSQNELAAKHFAALREDFPGGRYSKLAMLREMRMRLLVGQTARVAELAQEWREAYDGQQTAQVNYLHGLALQNAGRYREAAALFREAAAAPDAGPYERPARYQLCNALLQAEDFKELITACIEFLDAFPESKQRADVMYFAAIAYRQTGDMEKAKVRLEQALEATGDSPWENRDTVKALLADVHAQTGTPLKAAVMYDELAEGSQGTEAVEFTLEAADLYAKADQMKEAISRYRYLLFDMKVEEPGKRRYAALQCARLYLQQTRYDEAAIFLDRILKENTLREDPQLRFLLGLARLRENDYESAQSIFEALVGGKDTPASMKPNVRYLLTAALLEQGLVDQALPVFAEILTRPAAEQPEFDDAVLLRLAGLYYENNRPELTKQLCSRLLSSDDTAIAYQATLRLTQVLIAESALAEARKLLKRSTESFPKRLGKDDKPASCPELQSLLGEVHLLQGNADQAVRAFRLSLAGDELAGRHLARSQWGIAKILHAEGKNEEALRHAVNAFVMTKDKTYTPRAMWLAVQLLTELDRKNEAQTTWQELRDRFPAFAARHSDAEILHNLAPPHKKSGSPE